MEKIVIVRVAVGGEGAVVAEIDVEEVDAIVFFWFAAAYEEEIDVVAYFGGGL